MPNKTIFLIAGEPSGDSRGAELVRALRKENPSLTFEGLGGPKMQAAGVKLFYDLTSIAALGFGDVIRQYFKIRKIFYDALAYAESVKPDAIILIDYPGFNLRFAKKINKRFPVFYYISPQIWAWAGHRIHTIRRIVNHMLVLFPFEEKLYRDAGIPVTWVGHPLAEKKFPQAKDGLKKEFGIPNAARPIGLLPGSRESEVRRILPVILESALQIQEKVPAAFFLLSETDQVSKHLYDSILGKFEGKFTLKRIQNRMDDILSVSDAAIVASGTATLETAIAEVPLAIVYKTARSTYEIGKRVIRLPYIGLPNVISGGKIIQEFIQNEARPCKIAGEIIRLLKDAHYRADMISNLKAVKEALGSPGASERAAKTIQSLLS